MLTSNNSPRQLISSPPSAHARAAFFANRLSTASPLTGDRIARAIRNALSTPQNKSGPMRIDLSSLSLSDESHIKKILQELSQFEKSLRSGSLIIIDVSHNTFSEELLISFRETLKKIFSKNLILYAAYNAEETKTPSPFSQDQVDTPVKPSR